MKQGKIPEVPDLSDQQLLRYSRQIMLPEMGIDGQNCLLDACVLIIGLGGLGSAVAIYLAASGVGKLILADGDDVELSNLQRQIIHFSEDIGTAKTESAESTVLKLNPDISVQTAGYLEGRELLECTAQADLVVDASDNFKTRYAVNQACVANKKPLVSGAVIRMEGQVSVFERGADAPCYECLYPRTAATFDVDESCVQSGVLAPVVGVVGCVQATEAIKLIIGMGRSLSGRLLLLDAMQMKWHEIKLSKNHECPVCSDYGTVRETVRTMTAPTST